MGTTKQSPKCLGKSSCQCMDITDVSNSSFRAQFWFNSIPSDTPIESEFVTPSNIAISPLPQPKIKLQYAINVLNEPTDGIKAFARRAEPETTLVDVENGKFIFPPGGSFLVFLSNPESPDVVTSGRIAFGLWVAKI